MKCTKDQDSPVHPLARPAAPFTALAALKDLVRQWIIPKLDLLNLAAPIRKDLLACRSMDALLSTLVDWRLLTAFQADRIQNGTTFGLVLGNYRVLDRLGTGSMGIVYRGEHRALRLPVAIKVLPYREEQDPRAVKRFRNEVDTVASLSHPHIVAPIDVGGVSAPDDRGTVLHYFVMEYLHGFDLQRLIEVEGPRSVRDVCRWGAQLASALLEAQRHQLVHRDIKPSNIIITNDGRAKLLDFGLALHRPRAIDHRGFIVGTVDYMAPEQFENAYAVDTRADLYSLGGVLYWCLTGEPPFPCERSGIIDFSQRLTCQPPSPRELRPDTPREVDLLIRRLLMLHPEDRMDSPSDVARILRKFSP